MQDARLLTPEQALLMVVDVQERFASAMPDYARLIERTGILLQVFNTLNVPVVVSEQYPKGLGHTVPELSRYFSPETIVFEKTAFGCGRDTAILNALAAAERTQIVVCGIEAHICVSQTVHQLLMGGYQVHLVQDAVASRNAKDAEIGIAKMLQSGATPSSVEMALFEMLGNAKHPHFKELQALVK